MPQASSPFPRMPGIPGIPGIPEMRLPGADRLPQADLHQLPGGVWLALPQQKQQGNPLQDWTAREENR